MPVPAERAIICGDADDAALPVPDKAPLRLSVAGKTPNVGLTLNDVELQLLDRIPAPFRDLIEVATYVYSADQAVRRGGIGVDDLGEAWRRRLFFRIPVRQLDLWQSAAVQDALVSTLSFLSDDEYEFEFVRHTGPDAANQFLFEPENDIEEVVLFSGGLDSLAGAIRECVVAGRRVALVRHRPTKKMDDRTRRLEELLDERSERPPEHVIVDINKSKRLSRDPTQRARSFLYVSLGATVAAMAGLSRVRFYENGVVSLNLPPTRQVVGSKATRTTHPRVLRGYSELLGAIAGRPFLVENRFLWRTKTEVVRAIRDAGCEDWINFSTSCAHTWERTRRHPHCGSCSQCVDRKFAVLAARVGEDPTGYKFDVLRDEPSNESDSRFVDTSMVAAYVENASRITRMTEAEFFAEYGEAARALRHTGQPAAVAAKRIFGLHQRHAREVSQVIDAAIAEHATALRERTLPPGSLLRLVCDSRGTLVVRATEASDTGADDEREFGELDDYVFRRKNEAWIARYAGGDDFIVLPQVGAEYLHALLQHPGQSFPVREFAAEVRNEPALRAAGDAGPRSDSEATADFREQARRLQDDLEDFQERGDVKGEARTREAIAALSGRMNSDTGLHGRKRLDADQGNRIRNSVRNAIKRAIKAVRKWNVPMADHLDASMSYGWNVSYAPEEAPAWQLV